MLVSVSYLANNNLFEVAAMESLLLLLLFSVVAVLVVLFIVLFILPATVPPADGLQPSFPRFLEVRKVSRICTYSSSCRIIRSAYRSP